MGAIAKFQYQADLKAMRDMLTVCRRGNNLGIFPAGRNSSCGEGFYIPESLAKLIKMCKLQVVTCHIDGSYLVHPKWAKYRRRGPFFIFIFINFKKCLSAEEVASLSDKELTDIINKELYFNDYEFNKDKQIHYKGKNLAVGLETTNYKCPHCGKEFTMTSDHNKLICSSCHQEFELLDTGFFKENKYFHSPLDYYEWERKEVIKELDKDIILKNNVICRINLKKGLTDVGTGTITLTKTELVYKGTINNEEKELHFPLKDLMSLPYRAGDNIEIADATDIYQFKLDNGLAATKYSLAVEELYKINN